MKTPPKSLPDLMTLLLWEGQLKNQRVQQVLGVQKIYATKLIAALRDENPGLVDYDPTQKAWVLKASQRRHRAPDFASYMRMAPNPAAPIEELFGTTHKLLWPDAGIFRSVHLAIAQGKTLDINYRSMRSPKGTRRRITPHAMINIGPRTHVRAYCAERESFRDFNLGRITDPKLITTPREIPNGDNDDDWHHQVPILVRAHSGLTHAQQAMIRDEYFQGTAQMRLDCRAALVGYLVNGMRIAVDAVTHRPPEYLLECANLEVVEPWLFQS